MEIPINKFPEIKVFDMNSHEGDLGFFRVTYNKNLTNKNFDQDSISFIKKQGTVKGLHFQKDSYAQDKFVSVLQGEILDVVVDIDQNSSNFLNYSKINLSSSNHKAILIPKNFAHGYVTLSNNVIISYKIAGEYKPDQECTIKWNDPNLAIAWPNLSEVYISEKDKNGLKAKKIFKL